MDLRKRIRVARGNEPADLLLQNAQVINVFSGEIHRSDVAVCGGYVVGFGDYEAKTRMDLGGSYLCPGFLDGHVHIESSMVSPVEFAHAVVPLGTTTIVCDPHEIANVLGLNGIRYVVEASRDLPLDIYVMLPSCVPATDLETTGARLTSSDMALFLEEERVLGVGEMMNFPGVLGLDEEVMRKLQIGQKKRIDGHAPLLTGKDLSAYVGAGIRSDHECTTFDEAMEKLRAGMHVMIREGSIAKNMEALLPVLSAGNTRRCMFVTDDRNPIDLLEVGHINSMVKKAIQRGVAPVISIQMATINTAEYFGLAERGAVAPGYLADLVVFDDFGSFTIQKVFKRGQLVAENGELIAPIEPHEKSVIRSTVNTHWMELSDFAVPAKGRQIRVMEIVPDQIITRAAVDTPLVRDGLAIADPSRDLLKVAVIERHMASGNVGVGFVRGFGITQGAIASSISHDAHNLVVVGTNDEDMLTAAIQLVKTRGGQTIVASGKVVASLPLSIAGLMSDQPLTEVRRAMQTLIQAARNVGCKLPDPFMAMSFLCLAVVPELKLTDKGLIDVAQFKLVPLFV